MTGSFRYSVKSGLYEHLRSDGIVVPVARCYSGHREGLNNSFLDRVHNIGPIPIGHYRQLSLRDGGHLGPAVIPIVPTSLTDGFALVNGVPTIWTRSAFYIHANSRMGGRLSSLGCIVTIEGLGDFKTPLHAREYIGAQVDLGDIALEVVA